MGVPVNLKDTLIVTRFDYRNLVRSAPGVIFLVAYLMVLVRLGSLSIDIIPLGVKKNPMCQLPAGSAPQQVKTKIQKAIPFMGNLSPEAMRFLECERPVVMSFFFLLSLFVVPFLVLLLSFNQVAGYLNRKSIRYILPKTGRLELYLGLFVSNLKFFTIVSALVSFAVTLGWLIVGRDLAFGTVVLFSGRIFLSLWLSAVPLIAFMSMMAAIAGTPTRTIFLGGGAYLGLGVVGYFAAQQSEYGQLFNYVLPMEIKYWFAYPSVGRFLGATVLMLCYTAAYLAIGWAFLRRRNV